MASSSGSASSSTAPFSNDPPRLHVDIPLGLNQSFKRSFQQFGFDVDNSPISAGSGTSGNGIGNSGAGGVGGIGGSGSAANHAYGIQSSQQGQSNHTGMEVDGNDRNKRARSEGPQNSNMSSGFANGLRHGHGHGHGRSGLCYTLPMISPDAQTTDGILGGPEHINAIPESQSMTPQASGSGSNGFFTTHSPSAHTGTSSSTPTVDSPVSPAAMINGDQTSLAPISALSLTRPDHLPEVHALDNNSSLVLGESRETSIGDRPRLPSLAIPALDVDFPMMDSDSIEVHDEIVALDSEGSNSPSVHSEPQIRQSEPPRIPTPEFEPPLRPAAISDAAWNTYLEFDTNISALRENSFHPRSHVGFHTHTHSRAHPRTLPEHSSRGSQSQSQSSSQLQTQTHTRPTASLRPRLPPLSFETQRSSPEPSRLNDWIDSSLRRFREQAIEDVDANSTSIIASLSPMHSSRSETRESPARPTRSIRNREPESSLGGPMFANTPPFRSLLPPERRHSYRAPPSSHLARHEENRPSLQEHVHSLLESYISNSTPFMPLLFSAPGGAETQSSGNEGTSDTTVRRRDSLEDSWNAGSSRSSLRSPSPRRSPEASGSTSNRRNTQPEHDFFDGWSPRVSHSDEELSREAPSQEPDRVRPLPPRLSLSSSSWEMWSETEPNTRSAPSTSTAPAPSTRNVLPTRADLSALYTVREPEARREAFSPVVPRSTPRAWERLELEDRPTPSSYRPLTGRTTGLTRHNSDSSASRPRNLPPVRHEEFQRSRPWLPPPQRIHPLSQDLASDLPPVFRRNLPPRDREESPRSSPYAQDNSRISGDRSPQLADLEDISRNVERRRNLERETNSPSASTSAADDSLRSFQRIRIFSDMMLNDAGASDLLAFRYNDGSNNRGTRLADHLAPSFASMRGRRRVLRNNSPRSFDDEDMLVPSPSTTRELPSPPAAQSSHSNPYETPHSPTTNSPSRGISDHRDGSRSSGFTRPRFRPQPPIPRRRPSPGPLPHMVPGSRSASLFDEFLSHGSYTQRRSPSPERPVTATNPSTSSLHSHNFTHHRFRPPTPPLPRRHPSPGLLPHIVTGSRSSTLFDELLSNAPSPTRRSLSPDEPPVVSSSSTDRMELPARVLANELRERLDNMDPHPRRSDEAGPRVRPNAPPLRQGRIGVFDRIERMHRPSPFASRPIPLSNPGVHVPPRLPPLAIDGDPGPGWIDFNWLMTHTQGGSELETRQGDRQAASTSSSNGQPNRPVIPDHFSHATRDRQELHNLVNRRTRVEPTRNPSSNNVPRPPMSGRAQGLQDALDILRRDGLPSTTEQRFRDVFQNEAPQATASGSNSSATGQWGDIAGDNGRTNFLNHGETFRRRRNRNVGEFLSSRYTRHQRPPSPPPVPPLPSRSARRGGHMVSPSDIGFYLPFAPPNQNNLRRDLLYRLGHQFHHPGLRHLGNPGDYVRDEEFDQSYEGLLALAASLGDVKPPAVTPESVISSLDTAFYKDWRSAESDPRCPICLDDYKDLDPVMRLNSCTHWFHKDCLEQWLRTARTCPVCRKRVRVGPGASSAVAGPSSSQAGPSRIPMTRDDSDDDLDNVFFEEDFQLDSGDEFGWETR